MGGNDSEEGFETLIESLPVNHGPFAAVLIIIVVATGTVVTDVLVVIIRELQKLGKRGNNGS